MMATFWGRHQSSNDKEEDEHADDGAQPLDQVHVCDLHCLGRSHTENHGNPGGEEIFTRYKKQNATIPRFVLIIHLHLQVLSISAP